MSALIKRFESRLGKAHDSDPKGKYAVWSKNIKSNTYIEIEIYEALQGDISINAVVSSPEGKNEYPFVTDTKKVKDGNRELMRYIGFLKNEALRLEIIFP